MSITERVLDALAEVAELDEVRDNPQLPLYANHVLDSLKTVELLVLLSDRFGVRLSPAELDPEMWATPEKLVAFMRRRVPS
jgi:D-alanine--poly(phosphoribitol) ligase subunit 2